MRCFRRDYAKVPENYASKCFDLLDLLGNIKVSFIQLLNFWYHEQDRALEKLSIESSHFTTCIHEYIHLIILTQHIPIVYIFGCIERGSC